MAWWCDRFNALPEAGGVMDQDYALMGRMSVLDNAYSFVTRLRSLKGEQIHSLTDPERRFWASLIEMGVM